MSGFDRDKHLKPAVLAGVALLLLCGFWLYSGYQQALNRLDRKAASARDDLRQLQESLQEFHKLKAELDTLVPDVAAASSQNLIASVENATQKVGVRSQLLYVRPQPDKTRDDLVEEGVEIRLEQLGLEQLVELLYQFENTPPLRVTQLRIRPRFDDPALLDTVMILSRFKEKR